MSKLIGLTDSNGEKCYTEIAPFSQNFLSTSVYTEDDIQSALSEAYNKTNDNGFSLKIINVVTGGLSLAGGRYFILTFRIGSDYGIQFAMLYNNTSPYIKVRAKYGGIFKSWFVLAYSN